MSPIFRKLSGRIAVAVALVVEGALLAVTGIGMSTTADDAENFPRLVQWLLGTPRWAPALVIPLFLLAFAAWVFRPDQITASAMREYKAANDRSWEFEPEFRDKMALLENQAEVLRTIAEDHAAFKADLENIREKAMSEFGAVAGMAARARLEAEAEELRMFVRGEVANTTQMKDHHVYRQLEHTKREFRQQIAAITARLDALPQSPPDIEEGTPQ